MRFYLIPALWLAFGGMAFTKTNPAKPPATTANIPALTEAARPSIVSVTQLGRGGKQEALGTGFIISKDGLIATNLHVIGKARRIEVQLSDGSTHEVTAIHATDPARDLAVIRIAKTDLKPLELGNSDKLKQGQPVVAIGHPQGLRYSVVDGIVAAMREVEGVPMIQIAIPIEQGNSGGPLLDHQGRVQGILSLKSAVTENLGFAYPINVIKPLLRKPNSVPMSRWLTVGRLDPKRWQPLMGAIWTQHAGVIGAEAAGEGFGGRALCLNLEEAPGLPFEVTVTVKLDDESGAAGLAFCADGIDKHYGFYPSGGKLRLTRFNGPDVFSWTILSDKACADYQPGEWNTLRVRVEEHRLECFINGTLFTALNDAELRGGRVGLCKFRQTKAEFKNFRVGTTVAIPGISSDLAAQLDYEMKQYLARPAQEEATVEKLLTEPVAARQLLQQRAKELEEQAASLRKLDTAVHRQTITRELVRLLQRPVDQTELLRAALQVAKHDNPELDVESYLHVVEHLADELRDDPAMKTSTASAALRLRDFLFRECGFHGTREDSIDDLSNSYLNEVLEDREGIPLTLSIVFLEITRRLGLEGIYGVSLPGRFMVAYDDKAERTTKFIDVFENGKILNEEEASHLIEQLTGRQIEEAQRTPATPREMIRRLLFNLVGYSIHKLPQALPYLDLLLALDPNSPQERLQRALMRANMGDTAGAKADLELLLENAPEDLDMAKVQALYRSL